MSFVLQALRVGACRIILRLRLGSSQERECDVMECKIKTSKTRYVCKIVVRSSTHLTMYSLQSYQREQKAGVSKEKKNILPGAVLSCEMWDRAFEVANQGKKFPWR